MQLPGIDLLHGLPEHIRFDAFTPKLISSIARFNGRRRVMSEISAHAQGGKVTPEQFLGTMYTQYVLGINAFNSYFSENQVDDDTYRRFNLAVGRVDSVMGGGDQVTEAAVYYPIETAQAGYIPRGRELYSELEDNAGGTLCMNSIRRVQETLFAAHVGFGYLDLESLKRCDVRDGRMIMPSGGGFEMLIIPESMPWPELDDAVRRLVKAGIRVIRVKSSYFTRSADDVSEDTPQEDLECSVLRTVDPTVTLDAPQIIHMTVEAFGKRRVLFVNTSSETVCAAASAAAGGSVRVYDPLEDEYSEEYPPDRIPLTVPPYGARIIVE